MAKTGVQSPGTRPLPRLRRSYFDCRYGQLHVHNAIPTGGGFDELTTLVCLHGLATGGRVFGPVMPELGRERSVYALDLPGAGESDGAPDVPAVEAGLNAVTDFLGDMRIRQVDILALGEGTQIARHLAVQKPSLVRRLALVNELASPVPAAKPAQPMLSLATEAALTNEICARLISFFN